MSEPETTEDKMFASEIGVDHFFCEQIDELRAEIAKLKADVQRLEDGNKLVYVRPPWRTPSGNLR